MKPIAIALIMTALALVGSPRASAAEPCNAQEKLHFICGTMNVEDLVQVPGTKWVIGSGLAGGVEVGKLHLIDSESKQWKPLFPDGTPQMQLDKATYAACPGARDLTKFSAHGLNIRANSDGTDTLYVVNHGGRDSIEFFTVDPKGAEPRVSWVGCAVMPGPIPLRRFRTAEWS